MKTVLLTGKSGFIGKNVRPFLEEKFQVLVPGRDELDLSDEKKVRFYLENHNIDTVIHCANPNPVKNISDEQVNMTEGSLRLFLHLYQYRNLYGKMVYLGSGAEYDKSQNICNVIEDECFRSVPKDAYGIAKYAMNQMAAKSENVYNLCLFACFGPNDHPSKFITHCIRCGLSGQPITIRQDCRFDYIHVFDLARMMIWMVENTPKHHMYNVSGCQHAMLSEIAAEVQRQMKLLMPIKLLQNGYNREYTANGSRFWTESGITLPMTLCEGISKQIKWEKEYRDNERKSC